MTASERIQKLLNLRAGVSVLQVLQLMKENKTHVISAENDVHILRDDDPRAEQPVGNRTGESAGGIQGDLLTDLQLLHAGQAV